MDYFKDKVVLITGASSGIGRALAEDLARRGASLILMARRTDRLNELQDRLSLLSLVTTVTGDVRLKEDIKRTIDIGLERFGRLDAVMVNAGYAVSGRMEKLPTSFYREQMETNVYGALETIRLSLDALKQSKGHIVLMGSIMSYVSFGGSSPYSMSKYALRALAESLYHELKAYQIRVTLVCPGLVESEIRQVDNQGAFHADRSDPVPRWIVMKASTAARKILKATSKGRREIVLTGHGKMGVLLKSVLPNFFHFLIQTFRIESGKQKARF